MRTLKTREAANLLSVSPNTLRTWERKFGCPRPLRTAGRHRSYNYAEIVALRDALKRGLSVPSAVSAVREGLGADTDTLLGSLEAYDLQGADRAIEASLALRSLERTVEEILLPALDEVRRRGGPTSTQWAAAARWGVEWLGRARRLSPATEGPRVVIADASGGDLAAARPSVRALELFCVRDGLDALTLPVAAVTGLAGAVAAIDPSCLVIAGSRASDEHIGRWLFEARSQIAPLPVALYLRPPYARAPERAHSLSTLPLTAERQVRALILATGEPERDGLADEANRFAQSS